MPQSAAECYRVVQGAAECYRVLQRVALSDKNLNVCNISLLEHSDTMAIESSIEYTKTFSSQACKSRRSDPIANKI